MSNDKNEIITQEGPLDDQFDDILNQFQTAMFALQMQDMQTSEQAFYKAKLAYNNMGASVNPEENEFLKLTIGFIEVTSRFLRANFYSSDERYNRSLDEFTICKNICDDSFAIFNKISPAFVAEDEYGMFAVLKFMFAYFRHLVFVMEKIVQKSLEAKEGKYVDEVMIFKDAAADLRAFAFHNHNTGSQESNNWVTGSVGLLNRIADSYEKKAERLEEKRRTIEFIRPTDRQVFIVHGHSEGHLRELKEILEDSFKIKPIILRDEMDHGKTIIEKLEHYGRACAFAFVIVTPDDIVENKKKKIFQARPNVLFELGWFCGRYGRAKVRILRQKETPLPSDLNGIVAIEFNDKIEEAYRRIQMELETVNLLQA